MPLELNDSDEKLWKDYRRLGTPEEIRAKRSDLEDDNAKYREKLRASSQEQERLQGELRDARKTVPEGSVQLTAEEAKAFKAYQELGKPEDLKKSLEDKTALEARVAATERKETAEAACAAGGFKAAALLQLKGASDLKYEVRKEKVDGEEVDVAYVTEPKQGAAPQKLTDYVDATWPDLADALRADGEDTVERKPQSKSGQPFPPQKSGGTRKQRQPTEEDFRAATEKTAAYSL